jgi:hypothetical protein
MAARETANCKLHLMGEQEVRWERGGTEPADDYTFFYGKRKNHGLGTGFFVHKEIISAVKVESGSFRMSYTYNTKRSLV